MRKGLDRKHIKPALVFLVALTGSFIIFSQYSPFSTINSRDRSILVETRCSLPTTPSDIYLVEPDSITVDRPVIPHDYHDDGLLEVSPTASHPLHDIITEAENKWHVKQNIASRNLREAYYEYQRRYGRLPPKGFDKW